MSPFAAFTSSFLITLVALLGVVATGLRAKRKAHLTLVALTVISLGVTIYFAERLGDTLDLDAAGAITPIHLFLAKLTVALYLAPVATGIATIRNPRRRRLQCIVAFLTVGLTVVTAATGTWMALAAPPL